MNPSFINLMAAIGFGPEEDGSFEARNRRLAYDDDCSDDERDDSFYEEKSVEFYAWAEKQIAMVKLVVKRFELSAEFETSAEYGTITVTIK